MSLKHGDLIGTILPYISIDEFKPKAGKENSVIVVAFYLKDQEPAEDLNTFIQRGFIDTLDVEVSPNTDDEGRYLVFVEMGRDETFPNKLKALVRDIENLSGKLDWTVKTYYSGDQEFQFSDPALFGYIILNPEMYVTKDKFTVKEIEEGIKDFFKQSLITDLTIDGNIVTMTHNRRQIIAEVVDVGEYDTVIGRNFLSESSFKLSDHSFEHKVLQNILSNCQILPIENYLCVNSGNKIMLLRNTQLNYGN